MRRILGGHRDRRIGLSLAALAVVIWAACDDGDPTSMPGPDPTPAGSGSLVVLTTTSGIVDTDGYHVQGIGATRPIAASDSIFVSGLATGARTISLDGVNATCAFDSPSSVEVTIAEEGTATAAFQLHCDAEIIYSSESNGEGVFVWNASAEGDSANLLFHDLNNVLSPRVSPEGERLAYFSRPQLSDAADLVVRDLRSGETTSFVEGHLAIDFVLTWAPDGERIAFQGHGPDIWVVQLSDSSITEVTTDRTVRNMDWSHDGTRFVFRDFDTLAIVNADGTGLTSFDYAKQNNSNDPQARWSPDGTRVAFSLRDGSDYAIRVANPAGPEREEPYAHPHTAALYDWSPDGEWLLFGSLGLIYKVRADGSDSTLVSIGTPGYWRGSASWNRGAN